MSIHPTAVIEEQVQLGTDVTVGPGAYIATGATIGDACTIGPGAVVYGSVTMGRACKVHAHAVLGDVPQDLAFKGLESSVEIGDRSVFREFVTVHRGTDEGTTTVIGNDCFFMNCSHVGHNAVVGNNVILVNGAALAGHVVVEDGAFLSANVVVHQFCRVGRIAMLGGNAGVSQDVPPFCTVASVCYNTIAGLNMVGLKRAGLTPQDRTAIKAAYKTIYRSNLPMKNAVAQVRQDSENPFALEFAAFFDNSTRGVCSEKGAAS